VKANAIIEARNFDAIDELINAPILSDVDFDDLITKKNYTCQYGEVN
jgi:hypothetical protein